jgi:radical SAM superfamily enzyme YgiQ (UPF0313 family)
MKNPEKTFQTNEKLKEYCNELKKDFEINKNILFISCPQINSEFFDLTIAKNKGYYAYPPTGLQYLFSALEHRNLNIEILDLNYELLKKAIHENNFDSSWMIEILEKKLNEKKYSVIGISNLFDIGSSNFFEITNFLKNKKCIIIAGGTDVTYNAKKILKNESAHFVCKRESENKINYLFDFLYKDEKNKPTSEILFKYNEEINETQGEKEVTELRGNLINSYNLISNDYNLVGSTSPYSRMAGKDLPYAGILLNRGCRGNCKFCDVRDYMGDNYRSRKVNDFLDEMTHLYHEKGIRYFEFLDDDFIGFKKESLEVLKGIIEKGLKITWGSTNGVIAFNCDEEVMEKMRDSGCIGFKIGVETGNAELLKKMGKMGTLEIFKKFSERTKKFPEMFIVDNYVLGLPTENFGQIMDSYNFSIEMDLDWASYSVYQPNIKYLNISERGEDIRGDFVPGKQFYGGKITGETIFQGKEILKIPKDSIPSREQLNHIWFAFNLIRNFILNKNLRNKNINKHLSWLKVLEERYPTHPYINFFIALTNNLMDNKEEAEIQYNKTLKNMDEYWEEKFKIFNLDKIMENFPQNPSQTMEAFDFLKEKNQLNFF